MRWKTCWKSTKIIRWNRWFVWMKNQWSCTAIYGRPHRHLPVRLLAHGQLDREAAPPHDRRRPQGYLGHRFPHPAPALLQQVYSVEGGPHLPVRQGGHGRIDAGRGGPVGQRHVRHKGPSHLALQGSAPYQLTQGPHLGGSRADGQVNHGAVGPEGGRRSQLGHEGADPGPRRPKHLQGGGSVLVPDVDRWYQGEMGRDSSQRRVPQGPAQAVHLPVQRGRYQQGHPQPGPGH